MPGPHCKFPSLPRNRVCFGRGPQAFILAFITFEKSISMNLHFIPTTQWYGAVVPSLQMRKQVFQGTELAATEGQAPEPRLCLPYQTRGKAEKGRDSVGDKIPWVR